MLEGYAGHVGFALNQLFLYTFELYPKHGHATPKGSLGGCEARINR